ncbi:neuromedin U [Xanthomarina sp. F1114]|uniref:neuromedin U n=1 Tax=Xanthomarina sp. F1114 TaxID=2996019 RepID=UPI00225DDE19|nr:neuromedin U [Xanthomarina sp. F1114]MCX7546654.1 neuromedin U [Xanthomarina sp. F1114]
MKKQVLFGLVVMFFTTLSAQENRTSADPEDGHGLEDMIQNPIANMVSIPINYNLSINDKNSNFVNFQPVIPIKLSKKWLLVTQTSIPFINAPSQSGYSNGVENITFFGAITPAKKDSFTWGAGPAIMLPTGVKDLGYEKFSIGPSVVALKQNNGFTYGLLVQNFFSVAGPSDVGDVNYLYTQVILSKKLNKSWYVYSSPNITADWNAASDKQWTIPLGAGAGKLITHNRYLPINVKAGVFKYVAHPTDADWLIQIQATFILKHR